MRDCKNCHYGNMSAGVPCFDNEEKDCFHNPDHPEWRPETNGDIVRRMTDEDLKELWNTHGFDDKYQPECAKDGKGCQYWNYTCELCPETFYNWLQDAAEVET